MVGTATATKAERRPGGTGERHTESGRKTDRAFPTSTREPSCAQIAGKMVEALPPTQLGALSCRPPQCSTRHDVYLYNLINMQALSEDAVWVKQPVQRQAHSRRRRLALPACRAPYPGLHSCVLRSTGEPDFPMPSSRYV